MLCERTLPLPLFRNGDSRYECCLNVLASIFLQLLVMALESWHEVCSIAFIRSQLMHQERMMSIGQFLRALLSVLTSDDYLEGKRENYQVCSVCFVQYCVQQLCTVQCTHIWTNITVVCWLDLAFLWLYCVLRFIYVRFSFLGLFCVIVYLCMVCFCCVRFSFFSTVPRDWLGRTSSKWPILCQVDVKL